jgi:PAS domain S-box-containing protein
MLTKRAFPLSAFEHLQYAPSPVIVCMGEACIVEFVNNNAVPLTKTSAHEAKGKPLQQILSDIFSSKTVKSISENCLQKNQPYTINEARVTAILDQKLKVCLYDITVAPVHDERGDAIGVIAYFSEVSIASITEKTIDNPDLFLNSLFKQAPVGLVCYRGLDFIVDYANDKALEIWGKSLIEVKGRPVTEIFPEVITDPIINARHNESVRRLQTGETHVEHEVRLEFFRNGKPHTGWYNYIHEPYTNSAGEIVGMLAVAIEVTDQVLAKEALMQSESRFRNILDQTPEPMIVLKGEDMVVDVANEPLLRTWRADKSVIGKPLLECLPEVRGQGIMEMLLDVYHNRNVIKGYDRPVVYDRGNGVTETLYYNFVYTPYVEANGEVTGVLIIGTDVTSGVLARQRVEESERRFRSIFETAGVSMWEEDFSAVGKALEELKAQRIKDLREYFDEHPEFVQHCLQLVKVNDVNQATLQMFEAETKEQLLGDLPAIFTPDTVNVFVDELIAIAENKSEYIAETRLQTLKGNPVFTLFHMKLSDSGKLDRVLFTLLDLTARKSAEEALRDSEAKLKILVAERTKELERINQELFRSNEDLQQFAHVASHDLKEPIRKITTFVDRVKVEAEAVLPQGVRIYLDKIERAANRMMSMVEGVLNYSIVNTADHQKATVDLNDIFASIEYDLEVPIQAKNARLSYSQLPSIEGVPILIFQLFYNLINNSLKFKHPHRDLLISVTSQSIQADGAQYALIIVKDNGIGFDSKYSEKIFETFTRLHTKDQYEGTGLGLSLCQKIVQRHGGKIWAKGNPQDGAEFYVQLPTSIS